jgi:hypothetical protein
LNLDAALLAKERFRAGRRFHPDYFRRDAFRRRPVTSSSQPHLKPSARIEYLLRLEGLAAKNPEEASRQVPPGLLEEVFALNEELDEIRGLREGGAAAEVWRARLERARQPIEAKRVDHEAQLQDLAARWDAGANDGDRRAILEALRDRFLERNYITNLLAGIERELNS